MSFTITFTTRPLMPETPSDPPTQTQVDIHGTGSCSVFGESHPMGVTKTGTLDATGATVPGADAMLCSGGVVTVPGTFDTNYDAMEPFGGTAAIAVAGPVFSVALASEDWQAVPAGTAAGAFALPPMDALSCPQQATIVGALTFVAKSSALDP